MSKRGLHLYKRLALTTLSALIGLGGAAQADIHAAGPVYGGTTQTVISCRVFNFGTVAVSITNRLIYDGSGNPVTVTPPNDTCLAPLAVGGSCVYVAAITGNQAYSCRVIDTSSTPTNLSGAAEASSPTEVLTVLPLTH
jgi:hypothetical protein